MVSELQPTAEESTGAVAAKPGRVEGVLVMYCGGEIAQRLITEWNRIGLTEAEMEERALRLVIDVTGMNISL